MFCDAFQWHIPTPTSGDWFTIIVDLLRPVCKPGYIKLRSASYKDQPYINLNFFADDLDLVALREGVCFINDIVMNGDEMKDLIGQDYPWPMPRASDEAMNKMILERSQTGFHPCGTNRMGKDIEQGWWMASFRCSASRVSELWTRRSSLSSQTAAFRMRCIWWVRRTPISSRAPTQNCMTKRHEWSQDVSCKVVAWTE